MAQTNDMRLLLHKIPDTPAAMPDQLSAVDAAPLLCAGVTTFNALRHSGAMPGDVVAVLGIGGYPRVLNSQTQTRLNPTGRGR